MGGVVLAPGETLAHGWRLPALAAALALLAALTAGPARAEAASRPRPNIVFITTDDQTAASLHVMSLTKRYLVRRGVSFENSFVSFPLCCPSNATHLTGQYAHNHRVLGNVAPWGGFSRLPQANLLPVWLEEAGYRTIHVGNYLTGYGNRDRTLIPDGWSDWYTTIGPSTFNYLGYTVNENGRLRTYGADGDPADYQTDHFSRRAANLIEARAPSRQPYFLWLDFLAPHSGKPFSSEDPEPYFGTPDPAKRHAHAFEGRALPRPPGFDEFDVSDKPIGIRNRPPLERREAVRENHEQRLESLLAVDEGIARVVAAISRSGELSNTLVVFTSDNGYFHGEHRVPNGKVLPYEPAIRVPLVIRGPGVPRGAVRRQSVANTDIAPTIVAAARAEPGRRFDGRSLFPLMRDPLLEWGRDLLLERGPDPNGRRRDVYTGIRTESYKYVEYRNGERELYHLARDPGEVSSRHRDPAFASIMRTLARRLARLRHCRGRACRRRPALSLRLRFRDPGRRLRRYARGTCVPGGLRIGLAGRERRQVRAVDVFVGRRSLRGRRFVRVAAGGATLRRIVSGRTLRRGRGRTRLIRAQAKLAGDRAVSLDRRVRICGR